jgi:GT2 family glycosyltransferase
MPTPLISVVIPSRGHVEELRACLTALQPQVNSSSCELVVVDSGGDPAVASVAAEFPGVRLISHGPRLYPGAARNLGAREARGEYLAFIDVDCIPEPDWMARASAALQAGGVVVAGAVLDTRRWHPVAASDNLLQFSDFSPRRPDGPIANIPTCNFAVSREAFFQLGGFVSDWPVCEDGLFSTAAAARWPNEVRFVSAMRVRHPGRSTLPAFWAHQRLFGFYRGRVGSRLRRTAYQRWGRWRIFMAPIVCVRLIYLLRRTAQWDPVGLLRFLVLLPILLSGLVVWAAAFRRGCRAAADASR